MDRQLEGRAAEFFQHQKYAEAADVYTQCLEVAKEQNDRTNLLLNRASCYLKQSLYAEALGDCDEILKDDEVNEKALWKKIKVLCFQGSFHDAHNLATDWIQKDPENALAAKELRRLEIVMGCFKDKEAEVGEQNAEGTESNSSARSYSSVAASANSNNSSPQYSAVVSGAQHGHQSQSVPSPSREGHTSQSLNPLATEFVPRWQH
ncbi:protein unc-45 homolog B-like isoform X2 [Liolophura sinensis]